MTTGKSLTTVKAFFILLLTSCFVFIGMLFAGCDAQTTGISATYNQGSQIIYASGNVDDIDLSKLSVYERYDNGSIGTEKLVITSANLSLANGGQTFIDTHTVVVTYNDYVNEFVVNVSPIRQDGIYARYTPTNIIYAGDTLSDLKISDVLVKVKYNDNTLGSVIDQLSILNFSFQTGTSFVSGINVVVVSVDGYTTTFNVNATALVPTSIRAEWNNTETIYSSTEKTIEELKDFIDVYFVNNNGEDGQQLNNSAYTLQLTTGINLTTAGNKVLTIIANNHPTFYPATLTFSVVQAIQIGLFVNYTQDSDGNNEVDENAHIYTNNSSNIIATKGVLTVYQVWNDDRENVLISNISSATYAFPEGQDSFNAGDNQSIIFTLNGFSVAVTDIKVEAVVPESITVQFNQGSIIIYNTTDEATILGLLTVTTRYNNGDTSTSENYEFVDFATDFIVGVDKEIHIKLTNYSSITSSFIIPSVVLAQCVGIEATYEQGSKVFYTSDTLSDIDIADLTLVYIWNDGRENEIIEDTSSVELSYAGSKTEFEGGNNAVVVTLGLFTDDILVIVTAVEPTGIEVTKTVDFPATIYTSTNLTTTTIKNYLIVIVKNNDDNNVTLTSEEYNALFTTGNDFTTSGSKVVTITPISAEYSALSDIVEFEVLAVEVQDMEASLDIPADTSLYTSTDVTQWLTMLLTYNDGLTGIEGRTYSVDLGDCTITYSADGGDYVTTLSAGTSVVMKVEYSTFIDTVILGTVVEVTPTNLSADTTNLQKLYTEDEFSSLNDLKSSLIVQILNNDGTVYDTLTNEDYTLTNEEYTENGNFTAGLKTITISSGIYTSTTFDISILSVGVQATGVEVDNTYGSYGESYTTGFDVTNTEEKTYNITIESLDDTSTKLQNYWYNLYAISDTYLVCIKIDGFLGAINEDSTVTIAAPSYYTDITAQNGVKIHLDTGNIYWTFGLSSVVMNGGGIFTFNIDLDGDSLTTQDSIILSIVVPSL